MKYYIEKNGDFYAIPAAQLKYNADLENTYPARSDDGWPERIQNWKTDNRDFEIGAMVYFENVGWTQVAEKGGLQSCTNCVFEHKDCFSKNCECRLDGEKIIFKKIGEYKQGRTTEEYYVLNTRTRTTEVVHTSEEAARAEAERIAKKQPGHDIVVLKVVGKAKATANVEWTQK